MEAGDTFLIKDRFGIRHLYVVVSDPQKLPDIRFTEHVFLVMFTSREEHKEDVCVLKQGEHPSITHDTVIAYKIPPALFESLSVLQKLQDNGIMKQRQPVSPEILSKIREGYLRSRYKKSDIENFLCRQGVLDWEGH